jgi:hypothetical protein
MHSVKRVLVVLILTVLAAPGASAQADDAPAFDVSIAAPSALRQGERGEATIRVALASGALERAVAFLNVVKASPEENYPQAAHLIFADASETPSLFRLPLDAEAWREGRRVQLSFALKPDAPPGKYFLVVQLFRGRNTDPNRVRVRDRLALVLHAFTVEPR